MNGKQAVWLSVLAFIFLYCNLGSVCSHCLYNSATGWSRIMRSHMRLLAIALGIIGIIVAAGNVWAFFIQWLSLLGILVPPIGAIILVDQYALRPQAEIAADWRPSAFLAWGCGSVVAFFVENNAPQWSTAISAALVAGVAYLGAVGGDAAAGGMGLTPANPGTAEDRIMPMDYEVYELGDVRFQRGATLRNAKLAYKTFGTLNADKSNVVVYPTWYSGQHTDNEWLIGAGMALDPDKYFIIIPNMFGNGLSSSPSNTPEPYNGPRFPTGHRLRQCARRSIGWSPKNSASRSSSWSPAGRWARCRPSIGARSIPTWSSASCRSAAPPSARATISSSSKASRRR